MTGPASDERWMRAALSLARRGLGRTWPNPAVGCVVVRNGFLVGQGWTQPGGRPHAEAEALAMAGEAARGGTVYVTLEPCSHHGRTPPCADALVTAGVERVVVACGDPDPRVSGRGFARLREAGIAVENGVLEQEARAVNAGFLKRLEHGLPLVTLKTATTLDGRIALANGESQWITGPEARRYGHFLRATHDAILVGRATAAADDPQLSCRLAGLEQRSPVRVVLDSKGALPGYLKMFTDEGAPTWRFAGPGAPRVAAPVRCVTAPLAASGDLDIRQVLQRLAEQGITRLLVEGGGGVAASLLAADLVDRIVWFRAPCLAGGDGLPAVGALGLERIADMRRFSVLESRAIGDDILTILQRSS